jgi:multicomponent Na+:H+ antiporter subunit G
MVRMPDLYSRMQSSTKASTLGVACMLLAVAVHFNDLGIIVRALAASIFFLLTAPVSAHLVGRASYFLGVPLWEGTVRDELRGHYDLKTHRLDSGLDGPAPGPILGGDSRADEPITAAGDIDRPATGR